MNIHYKEQQVGCLLGELAKQSNHTQRSLALTLGVAVSVVHGILKQCIEKNLILIERSSQKKCSYLLTEQGVIKQSEFAKNHWRMVLSSLQTMRHCCVAMLEDCSTKNQNKLVLIGSELIAEFVMNCSKYVSAVKIHAVWDMRQSMQSLGDINISDHYDSSWHDCYFILSCLPQHSQQYIDVLKKMHAEARVIDPLDYMLSVAV